MHGYSLSLSLFLFLSQSSPKPDTIFNVLSRDDCSIWCHGYMQTLQRKPIFFSKITVQSPAQFVIAKLAITVNSAYSQINLMVSTVSCTESILSVTLTYQILALNLFNNCASEKMMNKIATRTLVPSG